MLWLLSLLKHDEACLKVFGSSLRIANLEWQSSQIDRSDKFEANTNTIYCFKNRLKSRVEVLIIY